LTQICNRDVLRKQAPWVPRHVAWTERFDDLLTGDADVIVELIGGLAPAAGWVRSALTAGKSVVTANKQLVARFGPALMALARRKGLAFRYEASVAGAVPVLRALQDGLSGDRIARIEGVLNGTCNYILGRVEQGLGFDAALREAQARGFAEADPTADVDGRDAQAKLAILGTLAFRRHVVPDQIVATSIRGIGPSDFRAARRRGRTIRQVSTIDRETTGNRAGSVRPALVPVDSWLARASGSQNVVLLHGAFGGPIVLAGAGAGGDPTAVAVLSDLLAIAHRERIDGRTDSRRSAVTYAQRSR
jgi:homoserine dehydrogenase